MDAAYDALSAGGLAILESATGTGKSLSLICSALTWLRDHRETLVAETIDVSPAGEDGIQDDIPGWLLTQTKLCSAEQARAVIKEWDEQMKTRRQKAAKIGIIDCENNQLSGIRKRKTNDFRLDSYDEDDFVLEDKDIEPRQKTESPMHNVQRPRIYICSRTHSQLSQLVREVNKTEFGENFSFVTLGSRKQCCINPSIDINEWSNEFITDMCQKLVDTDSCDFYSNTENLSAIIATRVLDIEDVCIRARSTMSRGCPYFASKKAAVDADVILVPYTSIITETTRQALSIDIKKNILIIDEAHNFLESINSSLRIAISSHDMLSLIDDLKRYITSYNTRLSPAKLVSLKQLQFLVGRISKWTNSTLRDMCSVPDFVGESGINGIDMNAICLFLARTDFMRKLRGFAIRGQSKGKPSTIYTMQTLMNRIQSASEWDRICIVSNMPDKSLVYISIDTEKEMVKIVDEAHAVLLVGGTMKPLGEFKTVASMSGKPFRWFSGSHNISNSRLFARIISQNEGQEVCFTHEARNTPWALVSTRAIVMKVFESHPPGGVIMFTPSYEFAQKIHTTIVRYCEDASIVLICDNGSQRTDDILRRYKQRVESKDPVLLISVVNGSLSEGIDFKDELCRCVLLIGLPYAKITDPILHERMEYFDSRKLSDDQLISGREYYENRCMKAVNQCIGRAIRHSRDWAAVILVDNRYRRKSIQDNLSDWFQNCVSDQDLNSLTYDLRRFFESATRLGNN
jgi:chromosome transmission fidelity protein 1